MKKQLIALWTALVLAVSLGTSIQAHAVTTDISPFWANVQTIALSLSFSGGQASASGTIIGQSGTSGITATFTLKERNGSGGWDTKKTWSNLSSSSIMLGFSGTASATQGKTYRLYVSANVTNSAGSVESVSDYYEKSY